MRRLLLLIVLCTLPGTLSAQTTNTVGSARGTVVDQTGAVLRGAGVTIAAAETTLTKESRTDQEGRYSIDGLPPGRYRITVDYPGFEGATREIVVTGAGAAVHDFSLALAARTSAVQVTAVDTPDGKDALVFRSVRTSDTAALLDGMPGVSLYGSGGLSSLPVLHGMADDRVEVRVNGMPIESACSNHMNPALSYIAPAAVGRISVAAGITPVSVGGDSIGGTISVDSAAPVFAKPGTAMLLNGSLSTFYRNNARGKGGHASVSLATDSFRVAYTGSYTQADNYTRGNGAAVMSTLFEATNHAAQVAYGRGSRLVTLDLGLQDIPQQGFANARMDMTYNRAKMASVGYRDLFGWGSVTARGYYQYARHEMNILSDKIPGMNMPMETRGTTSGYAVKAEMSPSSSSVIRIGNEFSRFQLNDWWPPVMAVVGSMGPNTLWNVRDGTRDRFGTYAEWEAKVGAGWTSLLGVRSEVVRMNTGNVAGYNDSTTTTGSAAYAADAADFNARDHSRLDGNIDLTAVLKYAVASTGTVDIGFARKTRSPSLYERYLWVKRSSMSVQMNGWFGDGNGYAGNLDLKPEVANTLSATAGLRDPGGKRWDLTVTPYYTHVANYIDVDRCAVIAGSNGCTAAKLVATTGFVNLQFANHAAKLYGVDASAHVLLADTPALGAFTLAGVASYVRGTNLDTGDNLYQIMPLTTRLAIEHRLGKWTGAVDVQAVAAKTDVQTVRIELPTAGYTLVNLRASYQWKLLRIDAGIENLFDRAYSLPLGGRYWVGDKTGATQVPGIGRSAFSGLTVSF